LNAQVTFLRHGHYAVASAQHLDVRVFGEGSQHSWALGSVASIATVGGELWAVGGDLPRLLRWAPGEAAPTTERSGSAALPGLARGRLATSSLWRSAAGWNGTAPVMITASATTATSQLVDRSDLVVPLMPSSWLHALGATIWMRRGLVTVWQRRIPDAVAIREAEVLFDGRSIALVAEMSDGGHRLLVLGTRDGELHQSLTVRGLLCSRFVPALGQVVLCLGTRVSVLELRFGSVLAEWPVAAPPSAVAVSDDGARVVLAFADSVEEVAVARQPIARSKEVAATAEPAPIVLEPVVVEPLSRTESSALSSVTPHPAKPRLPEEPLLGLWPKSTAQRPNSQDSATVLEHHLDFIAALVVRAIAEGWDTGRINRVADDHPYLTEILGIIGATTGRAQAHLGAAQERVATKHEQLLALVRGLGGHVAPLTRLAAEFSLTPLATQILMVIAAPLLRGELARLYGILASDPARPIVDELLVHQILRSHASRSQIMRELDRDAPLQRFGLVHNARSAPRPFRALTPDALVIRHLRDLPMSADVTPNLRAVAPLRPLEELRAPRDAMVRCLIALAAGRQGEDAVRLVVRGRTGSGRRSILAAIAARAGRTLGVIDASQHSRDPEVRMSALEAALVDAMLRGWLPCVVGLDDVSADDQKLRAELVNLFGRHPGPLALHLSWSEQPPLAPGYILLDLPPLLERERVEVWTESLARHGLVTDQIPDLSARYRIAPGIIERVTSLVAARGGAFDVAGELDREIRQHLEVRLGQLAQRVERLPTWADVALPGDVKDSLLELIARIRQRRRVFEEWGFDRKMTSSRGVTALFQGGPGTGKSMVAGVIARELGLDLYRVDLSRVVSKWIGETERNLAMVFDAAEEGQCIILFDEADSLFARRTEVRSSNDRYANLEVNFLLQRLDTFEGIALLTTNFSGGIDGAFKRRLSLRLTFPFPDEDLREQLWRAHLPSQMPRQGEFDLASLARRYAMSGGYIRNAALRAAFLAAEEGSPLTQQHLERAVRLEFREIGKLSESGTLE
jgi:hypothetical protein